MTYLLLMGVVCNMTCVRRIFNKIGPPGSQLWVIYLTILQLKPEVGINSDKLCIYPSEMKSIVRLVDSGTKTLTCQQPAWYPNHLEGFIQDEGTRDSRLQMIRGPLRKDCVFDERHPHI